MKRRDYLKSLPKKGQRITVEGDESLRITGDRVFLRQAVVNIIHNAVKYSPSGGAISASVHDDLGGRIRLEVVDSGPGIAPERARKIFDRFYRVDESRSRDGGGAGLGLSIAQWAVRLHGGDIYLRAGHGQGSLFQICLPGS